MKENNKGITLLILSITVMLILLIGSTTTYYGLSALHNAKLTKFETELKIMQAQVELWEEEGKVNIGRDLSNEQKELLKNINDTSKTYVSSSVVSSYEQFYRYLDSSTIRNLGIDGIEGEYLVLIDLSNISQEHSEDVLYNRVISIKGLKYRGHNYYTLEQLQNANLTVSTYSIKSNDAVASLTNKATGQVTIFSSVQDAVDAAGSNPSIVTLLKDDITEAITIGNTQNIILDTNGKKLTYSSANTITNLGILTIEGEGTIENTATDIHYSLYNSGIVNFNSSSILSKYRSIDNRGTFNLNGGLVEAEKSAIRNYSFLNINKGIIKSINNEAIYSSSTEKGEKPAIKISGGTIEGNSSAITNTVDGNGDILITNGTIKSSKYGINSNAGNLTVSGGKIITESTSYTIGIYYNGENKITIDGGTISATDTASGGARGIRCENSCNVEVNGGEIIATSKGSGAFAIESYDQDVNNVVSQNITISGGTIKSVAKRFRKFNWSIYFI